jgi:hypothetical protein
MTPHQTGHDAVSSEGTVTVTETGTGTYTQQITAGHHRLVSDEPPPIGDDAGPTPYDLLLAALGMYLHDGADVRQPQRLATRAGSSDVAALAHPRERLLRL